MSTWKWIAYGAGGMVLTILLGLGFYLWTPGGPAVDRSGLRAAADAYDVEIIRDAYGVPHIYGAMDPDVAFGLGFAQAEDDWATVQSVVALTRGELARHNGADAAPTDFLVDWFGIWPLINEGYETEIPDDVRALAEAYADGLNLYAADHPDEVWDGILPVRGQDVIAGFVFRTPFFYGFERTLRRVTDGTYAAEVRGEETHARAEPIDPPRGSNAMAVAPHRSTDGATRLLINSHQPFTGPVAWYQIRLHSDEGWDVAGGTFPGAPLMLHGHNRVLGWANTVNRPDVVDVYHLRLNPENDHQYWFDGEWRDLEVGTARFRVHLWGPFSLPIERETLRSVHGPVMMSEGEAFALRYAGQGELRQLEQYYRLNRAQDFGEWANAMRMQALPSINYVYGDAEGNIAFVYNAQMPDRVEGPDWQGVLPGDDPALVWDSYVPLDALPMVINPDAGYVANANNDPRRATSPSDDVDPAWFPDSFGLETRMTNRSLRLLALLEADLNISDEDFLRYKFDHGYTRNSLVGRTVAEALALPANEPLIADAQEVLRNWDYQAGVDSRGAALALMTAAPALAANLNETATPDVRESLLEAATALQEAYGRLDPEWGEVNRLIRGDVNLPVAGGPDALRAIWTMNELDEDGQLTAFAGDTLIIVAEWQRDGTLRSRMVHQFGSATLDDSSPHFADQAPIFADERLLEFPLSESEVRAQATRIYRPDREDQ